MNQRYNAFDLEHIGYLAVLASVIAGLAIYNHKKGNAPESKANPLEIKTESGVETKGLQKIQNDGGFYDFIIKPDTVKK